MTSEKVQWRQMGPHRVIHSFFKISIQLFICFIFYRKVHHSGLGKEGDSVPRFRGETGSTEEAPCQCLATNKILHKANIYKKNSENCCKCVTTGGAASRIVGWPHAAGDVARWWAAFCRQCCLLSDWSQEGQGVEQRGCSAGYQWGH